MADAGWTRNDAIPQGFHVEVKGSLNGSKCRADGLEKEYPTNEGIWKGLEVGFEFASKRQRFGKQESTCVPTNRG